MSNPSCICPAVTSNISFNEEETLEAMAKFRKFYEEKIIEIDLVGGGDCKELKIKLQERWIKDLTEQTEMMATIVKELEEEATTRVKMLEEKLKQTSKAAYELKKDNEEKKSVEIEELEKKLKKAEEKIRRMRPCVDLKTACTSTDKVSREHQLEQEICHRQCEVDDLKCKCHELEKALESSQARAENLQKADSKYGTRSEVKKLRQQKRCYEHALECFRNEMGVMSEQLVHLQEILKLSNQSCKEENGQLYKAIVDLQHVCDRLQTELIEAEKKIIVENQMNQLKDQKIDELQLIIGQKNADLNVHDEAIREMKKKLENSVIEHHELQSKIVSLNSTVMQLQCALASCGKADDSCKQSKTVEVKKSVTSCHDEMESKNRKIDRLQAEYQAQHEVLKSLQQEFEKIKEKERGKTRTLKHQNEVLHDKLATSELKNDHLIEELGNLRDQATVLAQKECCREHELAQSKQIILELRQTLIDLNESLAESEFHQKSLAEIFQKKVQDDRQQEDIYLSTQCEIALYKKLVEDFKASIVQVKKNLADVETQNKSLHEELKHKDSLLNEIHRKFAKKEKETSQHLRELTEKLQQSQNEEKRLNSFIENLKAEIHRRIAQSHENKSELKGCCRCESNNEMASTQEEITSLKVEIKRMIHNQLALNNENDKLLKQVTTLQTALTTLEEKNRHLKQKLEKTQSDNQKLRETNKLLHHEKETYNQTIKNLEMELSEARNYRDDICAESKHVMNNVKAWLEEQKKINDKVKQRTQYYCDTIMKLKQENANLLNRPCASPVKINKPLRTINPLIAQAPPIPECQSPWCLGSQGMDSPRDSPSSFLTCSVEEWYSPNYRDETDFETDHEDEFVNRLEAATLEMKTNNKKWKQKCECMMVSKDEK